MELLKQQGRQNIGSGANLSVYEVRWLANGGIAKIKQGFVSLECRIYLTNFLTPGM